MKKIIGLIALSVISIGCTGTPISVVHSSDELDFFTQDIYGENTFNVNNVSSWNSAINTIRNGGNNQTYIINVTNNISVPVPPNNENLFGSVTGLTVTILGGRTISISNSTGSLLIIGSRQEVIVKNITLRGRPDNNGAVVIVKNNSIFRMEDNAIITGNSNRSGYGGVLVDGGNFLMQGGNISSNSTTHRGGGVLIINNGTFTMQGGSISGNSSVTNPAGGVSVDHGTFIMDGGTISDNTSASLGTGVFVSDNGTFIMNGGIISGNTNNYNYDGGGGVFVDSRATFNKTGGIIYGNDINHRLNNISGRQGHAIFKRSSTNQWRNATAGPDDNTDSYGFWLND